MIRIIIVIKLKNLSSIALYVKGNPISPLLLKIYIFYLFRDKEKSIIDLKVYIDLFDGEELYDIMVR